MFNKVARLFSDRMHTFMETSAKESVYNVYVDLVREQMAENER